MLCQFHRIDEAEPVSSSSFFFICLPLLSVPWSCTVWLPAAVFQLTGSNSLCQFNRDTLQVLHIVDFRNSDLIPSRTVQPHSSYRPDMAEAQRFSRASDTHTHTHFDIKALKLNLAQDHSRLTNVSAKALLKPHRRSAAIIMGPRSTCLRSALLREGQGVRALFLEQVKFLGFERKMCLTSCIIYKGVCWSFYHQFAGPRQRRTIEWKHAFRKHLGRHSSRACGASVGLPGSTRLGPKVKKMITSPGECVHEMEAVPIGSLRLQPWILSLRFEVPKSFGKDFRQIAFCLKSTFLFECSRMP